MRSRWSELPLARDSPENGAEADMDCVTEVYETPNTQNRLGSPAQSIELMEEKVAIKVIAGYRRHAEEKASTCRVVLAIDRAPAPRNVSSQC